MSSSWTRSSSHRETSSPEVNTALFRRNRWDSTRLPSSPSHQKRL